MKITNTDIAGVVELDKRFYFPALLEESCPKCKAPVFRDFMDNYLSYPVLNQPIDIGLWCPACDHSFTVQAKLIVKLEPV